MDGGDLFGDIEFQQPHSEQISRPEETTITDELGIYSSTLKRDPSGSAVVVDAETQKKDEPSLQDTNDTMPALFASMLLAQLIRRERDILFVGVVVVRGV